MSAIHPTAIVEDGATIGRDVTIGPFSHIGPQVVIGDGSQLGSHVVVAGDTEIGPQARVFPFAAVGLPPQDLKFRGEKTRLRIGGRVIIRENVTINPGTEGGTGETVIGDNCALLAGAHVAHDCRIGDGCVIVNNAMVAGHCTLGDHVIVGGGAGIHQFVRIGDHAFVGGLSGVENDVIPFGSAIGNRAHLGGLNLVGLKRRGFNRSEIHALRGAYAALFSDGGTQAERIDALRGDYAGATAVQTLIAFVEKGGSRALCTPRQR